VEKIHLQEATSERDGLLFTDQIREHFGNGYCGIPNLQEGEDADKIVHGIMKTAIQLDSKEDHEISSNNEHVNQEQRNKE
jgi:hypothetical protein